MFRSPADTITGVLAVQNYGSSGSILVHSLFDGHPNVIALPAIYALVLFRFWRRHQALSARDLVDSFIGRYRYWFDPDDDDAFPAGLGLRQLGDQMDETLWVPEAVFRDAMLRHLDESLPCSRRDFIAAIHLAYAEASGYKLREPIWILFPAHSTKREYVDELIEDFPSARILYTLRDPVANFGSSLRYIATGSNMQRSIAECAVSLIFNDYMSHWGGRRLYSDRPYREGYRNRCSAIRLEDLHREPRATLERVCDWLSVPWDDCLLQSTFQGKRWWNRPNAIRISGFGSAVIGQQYEELVSPEDRERLALLADRKLFRWRYKEARAPLWRRLALLPALLRRFRAEILFPPDARAVVDRVARPFEKLHKFLHIPVPAFARELRQRIDAPEPEQPPPGRGSSLADHAYRLCLAFTRIDHWVGMRLRLLKAWVACMRSRGVEVALLGETREGTPSSGQDGQRRAK